MLKEVASVQHLDQGPSRARDRDLGMILWSLGRRKPLALSCLRNNRSNNPKLHQNHSSEYVTIRTRTGSKNSNCPIKKRERNERKPKLMLRSFLLVPVSSTTTRFLALLTALLLAILGSLSLTRTTHFGRARILDTQHI